VEGGGHGHGQGGVSELLGGDQCAVSGVRVGGGGGAGLGEVGGGVWVRVAVCASGRTWTLSSLAHMAAMHAKQQNHQPHRIKRKSPSP